MLEKWRQCVDNGRVSGALLRDLSKAFDCILHDLLIAKLGAYDFDYTFLLLQSYLSNRKVPQGSILGLLLLNIHLCDMFHINDCDIASYDDDNIPYASSSNLEAVINELGGSTNNLFCITSRRTLMEIRVCDSFLGYLCHLRTSGVYL